MFCRCADVSVTSLAVVEDAGGSLLVAEEQPMSIMSEAAAMTARTHGDLPRSCAADIPSNDCLFIFILAQIRAVPPPSAKRLKERSRIGIPIGLRLHQADHGLLIGLLCAWQRRIAGIS